MIHRVPATFRYKYKYILRAAREVFMGAEVFDHQPT